jgi:hypothetical protein
MNDKFDELAKGLARAVTRRQALSRFGIGLATALVTSFGLAGQAYAGKHCTSGAECHGSTNNICHNGRCVPCVPSQVCDCSADACGGCGADDRACLQCCCPYCGA